MLILICFDCNPASFFRSSFRFEFIPHVILSADLRAFDDLEIPYAKFGLLGFGKNTFCTEIEQKVMSRDCRIMLMYPLLLPAFSKQQIAADRHRSMLTMT